MSKQARLSIGDRWTYEKSFLRKKPKIISKYGIVESEKIDNVDTLIIDWEEMLKGGEGPLISGKFWIDEETERFVKEVLDVEDPGRAGHESLGGLLMGNQKNGSSTFQQVMWTMAATPFVLASSLNSSTISGVSASIILTPFFSKRALASGLRLAIPLVPFPMKTTSGFPFNTCSTWSLVKVWPYSLSSTWPEGSM